MPLLSGTQVRNWVRLVDLKVNTSVSEADSSDSTSRFGKSSTCSRIGRL